MIESHRKMLRILLKGLHFRICQPLFVWVCLMNVLEHAIYIDIYTHGKKLKLTSVNARVNFRLYFSNI